MPAIVSSEGGPAELIGRSESGLVEDVRTTAPLCAGIRELAWASARREEMSRRTLQTARNLSWDRVLDHF